MTSVNPYSALPMSLLAAFGAVNQIIQLSAAEATGDRYREAQRHTGGFKDTAHQRGEVLLLLLIGKVDEFVVLCGNRADKFIERKVLGELDKFCFL